MKVYVLFSLVCYSLVGQANFLSDAWREYQGHRAYVRSNYDQAGTAYTKLLQQGPYNPIVNYNMGLVLYAQKNYEAAEHYFQRAASHAKDNIALQEQAFFNQGNAYVEQKKLYEAIGAYSKVLEINSKNDRARHNLEYVKQLLQEQQQKDQQDKNDQQQGDGKDQQGSDPNQKQNESKSDSKKSDKKQTDQYSGDGKDQQDTSQQSDDSGSDKDGRQQSGDQKKTSKDSKGQQSKDESSKNSVDEKSKEDVADKLQKSSGEQSSDKDSRTQSKEEAQSPDKDPRTQSAKKDGNKEDTASKEMLERLDEKSGAKGASNDQLDGSDQGVALQDAYAGEMQQAPDSDERLDKRAALVMQKLQKQEDYMQKQLLKMNVSKQGAFGYGQKNW